MNEQLAAWVPGPVLAAVVLFALGIIWKSFSKRLDKIESSIELLHKFATVEQLGNMGNRFDERQGMMREDIGALRERMAKLEGRE